LVTAIGKGNATITVATEGGEKSASCSIVVRPPELRIVQWCDPQLGLSDFQVGIERCKKTVRLINEIMPDAVLIAGDMVHFPENDEHINAFLEIISHIDRSISVVLTSGNHDVCEPVTVESLAR